MDNLFDDIDPLDPVQIAAVWACAPGPVGFREGEEFDDTRFPWPPPSDCDLLIAPAESWHEDEIAAWHAMGAGA